MSSASSAPQRIAIVGANATGATAATTLRAQGFEGSITLIGEEPLPPYERPPLSKEVVRGEQGGAETRFQPDEFWVENAIDLRLGTRVASLDLDALTLTTAAGDSMAYDRLLLATGVRNRTLDIPGADLGGIYSLRTAADAEQIRHAALGASAAVVIGFGFIGAEVAASLRQLGLAVTIVEPASTALERVLGSQFGTVLEHIHRDQGVAMHLTDAPERFEGPIGGRVERVLTREGAIIDADLVVVGVGTQPNDELATPAGLAIDGGILVDAALRTSHPDVVAAGDVANHDHPLFGRIRVEHFTNAQEMGEHAASSLLRPDEATPYDQPHWFWSDQYDTSVQMSGFTTTWTDPLVRGSIEDRTFAAFQLDSTGRLTAVLGINANRDVRRSLKAIRAGVRPDPAHLLDPEFDLRELA